MPDAANSGNSEQTWLLRGKGFREVVRAADQWEAWDTLRERPAEDFGLVTTAEPDESDDPIYVQTATLMRRWGRTSEADQCDALARELGLV